MTLVQMNHFLACDQTKKKINFTWPSTTKEYLFSPEVAVPQYFGASPLNTFTLASGDFCTADVPTLLTNMPFFAVVVFKNTDSAGHICTMEIRKNNSTVAGSYQLQLTGGTSIYFTMGTALNHTSNPVAGDTYDLYAECSDGGSYIYVYHWMIFQTYGVFNLRNSDHVAYNVFPGTSTTAFKPSPTSGNPSAYSSAGNYTAANRIAIADDALSDISPLYAMHSDGGSTAGILKDFLQSYDSYNSSHATYYPYYIRSKAYPSFVYELKIMGVGRY